MRRRSAFTLIELLVVVAIIAVLIAILLPSLGKAKDNARKTVCASHLKTNGMGVAIYAGQFADAVPFFRNDGTSYPNDEPVEYGNTMLDISQQQANAMNGADAADSMRKIFWCPNNFIGSASANQWSSVNVGVGSGFRTFGYAYFNARRLPGTEQPGTTWANLDQNLLPAPRNPTMKWLYKWGGQFASQTEYAEDFMYAPVPATPLLPDLSNIVWVSPPSASPNNTPNADDGSLWVNHRQSRTGPPQGGNVLCLDGHVEWRAWKPGKMHWSNVQGRNLYWYYPDP
jgi:prepilin-type N-terminal cleavage/methylation domain-containing protein